MLPEWQTYSSRAPKENMLMDTHHPHGYTAPNYEASRTGFSSSRGQKKKKNVYTISDILVINQLNAQILVLE